MALKPCLIHGCPNYAQTGAYCPEHARRRAQLGMTGERGSSRTWLKARSDTLRRAHYLCWCGQPATVVHHFDLNPHNNDPANLLALCDRHHHAAHQQARADAHDRIGGR